MSKITNVSAVLLLGVAAPFLFSGNSPFVGTWKLDSRQSKFTIGDPSFMFATMQIEQAENGLKSTASGADGKGYASDFTFTCSLDGAPCRVVSMSLMRSKSAVDTVSLKRVEDRTILATGMKNGKLVYSDRRVVSDDNNTLTVARKGFTPDGKPYESTIVLLRSH